MAIGKQGGENPRNPKVFNAMARLGGFDLKNAAELNAMNQADLNQYNQDRLGARNTGISELLFSLSDVFKGVNPQQGAQARQQNRMLMQQDQERIARQQQLSDAVLNIANEQGLNPNQAALIAAQPDLATKYLTQSFMPTSSTADIKNYEFFQGLSDEDKIVYKGLKSLDPGQAFIMADAKTRGTQGGVNVSPLQEKIDEKFGTEAAEYLSGGQAQIKTNIDNLQDKMRILKEGELNVSGPFVGNLPEGIQSFANPDALSFIGDIRDIVFQSLREKLGAQFTEKEGDRLVAAAFDQRLPESANTKRLQRLLNTIKGASKAKEEMIAYYQKNKTLDGYKQTPLTFDVIFDSLNSEEYKGKSDEDLKLLFNEGDKATKNSIIRFLEKRDK